ncbi:glycosyltransferase [Chitinivorax sp. PXF-14]|uniref:glycosyltransferase family 2 protein n=1 Tax=Chitinivorax sp. PXF-14 TaxID=3230488 RepID=UPI003467BBA2
MISIIIPVYNTGQLLQEAVQSILAQECTDSALPPIEIIVVDDHSNDTATQHILAELATRDPAHLRVITNSRGKGVASARNTGIEAARGQWIGFLDSDDLWLPNALATGWNAVRQHPEARWIASHFHMTPLDNVHPVQRRPLAERSPYLYALIGKDYEAGRVSCLKRPVTHFLKSCLIGIMTCLIRKDLLIEAGMFDESQQRAEDYLLWLRCALRADLYFAPADTGIYRIRSGSLTHTTAPPFAGEDTMLHRLRADPQYAPYRREIKERMVLVLDDHCYYYRSQRQRPEARRWAMRLLREAPLRARSWKQAIGAWFG